MHYIVCVYNGDRSREHSSFHLTHLPRTVCDRSAFKFWEIKLFTVRYWPTRLPIAKRCKCQGFIHILGVVLNERKPRWPSFTRCSQACKEGTQTYLYWSISSSYFFPQFFKEIDFFKKTNLEELYLELSW